MMNGYCKIVIYNYVLCWLYSMTKSIVISLILFPPFFFVGFYYIGFSIKLLKNRVLNKDQCISRLAHKKFMRRVPVKRSCEKYILEAEESCQPGGFRKCLAGKAFLRGTRETFCLKDFLV